MLTCKEVNNMTRPTQYVIPNKKDRHSNKSNLKHKKDFTSSDSFHCFSIDCNNQVLYSLPNLFKYSSLFLSKIKNPPLSLQTQRP